MKKPNYEKIKMFNDYIKHINTLSTGSILLLVMFLEKLFTNPCGKYLVAISLISFLASVIAGVVHYTSITVDAYFEFNENLPSQRKENIDFYSILIFLGGFLLGMISLAIFGIINLFQ